MTESSQTATRQLQLYRKYSDMAHRTSGDTSEEFGCMAQEALRRATKLDPNVVANACALSMAKLPARRPVS